MPIPKRSIISNPNTLFSIIIQNPSLNTIGSFTPLSSAIEQFKADSKGCGCKRNKIARNYKGIFEGAMNGLTDADKQRIKSVLNVDEVCYYAMDSNNILQMSCF